VIDKGASGPLQSAIYSRTSAVGAVYAERISASPDQATQRMLGAGVMGL
jgi:hypothetical protein